MNPALNLPWNLFGTLRRLRWLRRAMLAAFVVATLQSTLLPCAMAFQSMQSGMSEHCVYCPHVSDEAGQRDNRGNGGGCEFSHSPTMTPLSSGQPVAVLASIAMPIVPIASHDTPYSGKSNRKIEFSLRTLSPPRPIALTYCVQLK